MLAIPNIGKIQGQKSLFDIRDRRGGRPQQELEDDTLPNFFFGGAVKQ
jgi:hypothetical protein